MKKRLSVLVITMFVFCLCVLQVVHGSKRPKIARPLPAPASLCLESLTVLGSPQPGVFELYIDLTQTRGFILKLLKRSA